jgi:alkanesulfonate monooxygenase SsuD/methylene tetrahydromethanopterin reductase-like flavin-dependent oxidoreductase (luciferase family)
MGQLKLGAVIWPTEDLASGVAPSWRAVRDAAIIAEQVGFDTVWIPDELQWESSEAEGPRGWWECVALASAVAEATTTINVGTWVLSALHRNPGLTVRVAETIDEISGGRFMLGYGAGHAGRQGEAFGFPPDKTVGRYEEALTIVTDLLRTGSSSFSGEYHSTVRQTSAPRGPRPGAIPLVLGGHGPRTMRLAVTHADIWSAYVTESSEAEAFVQMIEQLVSICEAQDRDPSTLSRSIGIGVRPPGTPEDVAPLGPSLEGTEEDIVRSLQKFAAVGATHVEIVVPGDMASGFERLAGVVAAVASI